MKKSRCHEEKIKSHPVYHGDIKEYRPTGYTEKNHGAKQKYDDKGI